MDSDMNMPVVPAVDSSLKRIKKEMSALKKLVSGNGSPLNETRVLFFIDIMKEQSGEENVIKKPVKNQDNKTTKEDCKKTLQFIELEVGISNVRSIRDGESKAFWDTII